MSPPRPEASDAAPPAAWARQPEALHPRREPLDALTSLRFVAAAYVLIFHYDRFYFGSVPATGPVSLGYSGVSFFFVLSGFILAYTYRSVDLGDPGILSRFRRARIARVYPLYLLSLLAALPWLIAWVLKAAPPLQTLMVSSVVLAPLGLHAFVPGAACALNCPSWSISAEVFFYLLFPALLPLVLRRPVASAVAALALWCVLAAASTVIWRHFAPGVSVIDPNASGQVPALLAQFIKYFPPLRLPEFVAGLLLFVLWQRRPVPPVPLLAAAALAAILLVGLSTRIPDVLLHNGLTVLVWAPLILAGASIRTGPLVAPSFVFLGRVSFALYLLHTPVHAALTTLDRALLGGLVAEMPWVAAILATGVTLALSTALHLVVEEPARRLILRRAAPPRRMAAAS